MQLAILVAVVGALAQGESSSDGPVGGAFWRVLLTLGGVLVAPLVAALGSEPLVRGLRTNSPLTLARCERHWPRLQAIAVTCWLAIVAATLYLVEWPRVVRGNWSLGSLPLVDELFVLLPVVLPLVLFWGVASRLHTAASRALAGARGAESTTPSLAGYVWLQVRQQLGLILGPPLVVIGVQEVVALSWPDVATQHAWWLYVPLLAAMLLLMPLVLRRLWPTSPLPAGPLREQLIAICRQQHAGVRDVVVWHTGAHVANAAVAGMFRGLRYVFLTDGLLARLSPDEVAAVLRHELGHIARRHLPLRLAVLVLPLVIWLAISANLPTDADRVSQTLAGWGCPKAMQLSVVLPAGLALYVIVVVGQYSRWLEHEADLAACTRPDGTLDSAAAQCFGRALVKVVGRSRESRFVRWLHPPLFERLAFLALAVGEPAAAGRFCRRLRVVAWGVFALYAWAASAIAAA
ncbi:MAG: M48 family metallopeptidase [Pirellulaceae bacterium]